MSDINITVNDEIVNIDVLDTPVYVEVTNSPGPAGAGVAAGGTTGQVLAKNSATNYDTAWVNPSGGGVPYSGATGNVNLGEYELKAGQLTLDVSPTGTAAVGTTRWNDTIGSSETTLKGGSVILKNGVDLVARVVNKVSPNTTLTKAAYQAVRVSGAQGQRLAVAFAQANNDANSADTIGLVTETIATNQEGFIITVGQLENINTTGSLQGETWADGDVLYLSPTTAGALTNVKPNATIGHIVVIGYVEYAHANNGKIYVKVMNGWELGELHDVYVPTPSNNDVLTYETSSGLWKNKSVGTALGYTPANSATTLTINGVTYDLSTSRTWTISTGISGSGASGQVAYWDGTTSQAGSADLTWNGTNVILGNDKGLVLQTAGTNRNILIKAAVVLDNFSGVNLYPQGGTNVGTALVISPKGTGFSAQLKSQVSLFNTDFFADSVNYEFAVLRAAGDRFSFSTGKQGTGTNRPFLLSSGYADGVTNANHLWLYTNGNVGINTSSDGGQRLQVQGTTLLNGNVTFSSATGMTWDATNSRLGIGTNAPAAQLNIVGAGASSGTLKINSVNRTNGLQFNWLDTPNVGEIWYYGETRFRRNSTELNLVLSNAGNVILGTNTDTGERLQVTGNVKIIGSGATSATTALTVQNSSSTNLFTVRNDGLSTFGDNITMSKSFNGELNLRIENSTSGANSVTYMSYVSSGFGFLNIGKRSASTNSYKIFVTSDAFLYNGTNGDIAILNDFASGSIKFAAGGASTAHLTIKSNGRINMSSLPTSATGLVAGDLWNDAGTIKIV